MQRAVKVYRVERDERLSWVEVPAGADFLGVLDLDSDWIGLPTTIPANAPAGEFEVVYIAVVSEDERLPKAARYDFLGVAPGTWKYRRFVFRVHDPDTPPLA